MVVHIKSQSSAQLARQEYLQLLEKRWRKYQLIPRHGSRIPEERHCIMESVIYFR